MFINVCACEKVDGDVGVGVCDQCLCVQASGSACAGVRASQHPHVHVCVPASL